MLAPNGTFLRLCSIATALAVAGCAARTAAPALPPLDVPGLRAVQRHAKAVAVTLVEQNVPPGMRSIVVLAGPSLLNTTLDVTPASKGCKTAAGKTACTIAANSPAGQQTLTSSGYSGSGGKGKLIFQTQFVATVKANLTVTVPNAIYARVFKVAGSPAGSVTKGPAGDAHVWFVNAGASGGQYIAEASTAGTMTYHKVPLIGGSTNSYASLEAGPASTLWFVASSGIGSTGALDSLTTAGAFAQHPTTNAQYCFNTPISVANGPDGNAWFLEFTCGAGTGGAVGKITPVGTITNYALPVDKNSAQIYTFFVGQHMIVAGSDGELWFYALTCKLVAGACQFNTNAPTLSRISTTGALTKYVLPSVAGCTSGEVALGGDGNVWVLLPCVPPGSNPILSNTLVRVTPAGVQTAFHTPLGGGNDVGAGPDGNLYLTNQGGVIRFVTSGPSLGQSDYYPISNDGITNSVGAGPDGYLYVTAGPAPYFSHGWLEQIEVP